MLCRQGIPESLRAQVWAKLANVSRFKTPGLYQVLLHKEPRPIFEVIERDIDRCYPDHIMFNNPNGQGQTNLRNVLQAYAHYNPEVEYCQGMGFLVGMMLMHMPAEESFWLLVATIEGYAKGFFDQTLSQIKISATVFDMLLKKKNRKVWKKMVREKSYNW
jgi:hypothetical protein